MVSRFAVLRDRDVLLLFTARSISLLGNAIATVAIVFAVLEMPTGSPSTLGLVLTARMLSQIAFVLLGGVIADRMPKQVVMVSADVGAGVVQALAAGLVITSNATPLALAGLAALSGAAAALFDPASRSLMPQLVSGDALQSANALLKLSMRGGSIVGSALAGLLIITIGPGPTLGVDAATFLVSAVLLVFIRARMPATVATGPSLLRQVRDGWREFTAHAWVWVTVSQLAFLNLLLAGGFYVLGPVVADRALGGAGAWSAILTAQAIGFVTGTVVAMRIRPRYPVRVAALLTLGFPVSLLLLGAEAPVVAVAVATFLGGLCMDVYEVTLDTTLQKQIPPEMLSRVMSYEALGSFAFVPLGLAIAGPVSGALGVGATLTWAGSLILATSILVLLVPSIRHVEDRREASTDATDADIDGVPEPAT